MRVILLGPPGAGKGTQAQQIHKKTKIPLVVMGDILREAIARKDDLGTQVESYVTQGTLVPDQLVIQVIMKRLQEQDCQDEGFLLDGFPRTQQQARALAEEMERTNTVLDHVLYFAIADNIVAQRIGKRRICKNKSCAAIYHLEHKPPVKEGICDICQSELYHRPDDNEQVILTRLNSYHQETTPLLDYYRSQNILCEVDADRSMDEVFNDALAQLGLSDNS